MEAFVNSKIDGRIDFLLEELNTLLSNINYNALSHNAKKLHNSASKLERALVLAFKVEQVESSKDLESGTFVEKFQLTVNSAFQKLLRKGMRRIEQLDAINESLVFTYVVLEDLVEIDWQWTIIDISQNTKSRDLSNIMRHFSRLLMFNTDSESHGGELVKPMYVMAWEGIESVISAAELSPWEYREALKDLILIIEILYKNIDNYSLDTRTLIKYIDTGIDSIMDSLESQ